MVTRASQASLSNLKTSLHPQLPGMPEENGKNPSRKAEERDVSGQ
jgi:hypothetical protein